MQGFRHVLHFMGQVQAAFSKLSDISPSNISSGLHVCVNTTSPQLKTYMHGRLDNMQSETNFGVTTRQLIILKNFSR